MELFLKANEALSVGEVPIGCVFVGENDQVSYVGLFFPKITAASNICADFLLNNKEGYFQRLGLLVSPGSD